MNNVENYSCFAQNCKIKMNDKQKNLYGYLVQCSLKYTDQINENDGWFSQSFRQLKLATGQSQLTLEKNINFLKLNSLIEVEKGEKYGENKNTTKFKMGTVNGYTKNIENESVNDKMGTVKERNGYSKISTQKNKAMKTENGYTNVVDIEELITKMGTVNEKMGTVIDMIAELNNKIDAQSIEIKELREQISTVNGYSKIGTVNGYTKNIKNERVDEKMGTVNGYIDIDIDKDIDIESEHNNSELSNSEENKNTEYNSNVVEVHSTIATKPQNQNFEKKDEDIKNSTTINLPQNWSRKTTKEYANEVYNLTGKIYNCKSYANFTQLREQYRMILSNFKTDYPQWYTENKSKWDINIKKAYDTQIDKWEDYQIAVKQQKQQNFDIFDKENYNKWSYIFSTVADATNYVMSKYDANTATNLKDRIAKEYAVAPIMVQLLIDNYQRATKTA